MFSPTFRRGLSAFALLCTLVLTGRTQHNLVLYNMQQVPQSGLMNPGQIPLMKGYFGLPGLGGISISGANSSWNYGLIDRAGATDEFDFGLLRGQMASGHQRLRTQAEVQLFNLGFRTGRGYVHLHVSDNAYASGQYSPVALALLDDLQQGSPLSDYDLQQLGSTGAYYRSYALGYAHRITPAFSVGTRLRYLQGFVGARTINQRLAFHHVQATQQFNISGELHLMAAGLTKLEEPDPATFLFDPGNSGFALDLGAVYRLGRKVELSLSAVNLGRIRWREDVSLQVVDGQMSFAARDADTHIEEWKDIVDDLQDGDRVDGQQQFTTPLPLSCYLSANYYVRTSTSFGLLINPVIHDGRTDLGLAVSANTRLGKFLGLSLAFGQNRYHDLNLGAGASFDFGPLQIYAATDNVLVIRDWQEANAAQGQVGINLNFGRLKRVDTLPADGPSTEPAPPVVMKKGKSSRRSG